MAFYGFVVTNAGRELIAKVVAGEAKQFVISRVCVGSGICQNDSDARQLSGLVEEVADATSTKPLCVSKQVQFTIEFRSDMRPDAEYGFWLNEFGVYAQNERKQNVLIYYGSLGDYPQWVNKPMRGRVDVRRFPVIINIGEDIDISVTYDCDAWMTAEDIDDYVKTVVLPDMATKEDLDKHNNDPNAHTQLRDKFQSMIDEHNNSGTAHPDMRSQMENLKSLIDQTAKDIQDFAYTLTSLPTQAGTLTYNALEQEPTWNNYNADAMELGGTLQGTDAQTYNATVTPKGKYTWADKTQDPKQIIWVINPQVVPTVPSQNGSLTYTGAQQSPVWANHDPAKLTLGGTTTGIVAGSYNATFTPVKNYCWNGGGTSAKTVAWIISKASFTIGVSTAQINTTIHSLPQIITVTKQGTGAVTAVSGTTGVATVAVSGTTVTVTSGATAGTSVVTISVAGDANYNAPAAVKVNVNNSSNEIFGIKWSGGSETTWSRTDMAATFSNPVAAVGTGAGSSPFDNISPWSGMKRSTDSACGEVVSIPKYWYKWTKSGTQMTLQIANYAASGFSVSPAHQDRGDGKGVRDTVYVGRYHCVEGYKSTTGVVPKASTKRDAARQGIAALGATAWQYDYAMYWTIMMLYLVEYANWDTQSVIGTGSGEGKAGVVNGATDTMIYHTGTNAENRGTSGEVQYRHIEGLWSNVHDYVDGIRYDGANVYIVKNPSQFSDTGGVLVGTRLVAKNCITGWNIPAGEYDWALQPGSAAAVSGYVNDSVDFEGSNILYVGAGWGGGRGAFFLHDSGINDGAQFIGCRLQILP